MVTVCGAVDRAEYEHAVEARFRVTRFDGQTEADLDAVHFHDVPAGERFELTDTELYQLERAAIHEATHNWWC
jgi:hypothetical protein